MLVFFNPTYEKELDDSGNRFKAVIPRALVKRALFTCHGHPLSGHAGRSKTLDRAKLLYYWPGMDRDTRIYVKACRHCQQYKPSQQKKCAGPYTPHNMTTPWEEVGATRYTPLLLNTGRTVPLPFDPRVVRDAGNRLDPNNPEIFVQKLMDTLRRAHQYMYRKVADNYERHKRIHENKYYICEFQVMDLVCKRTHILSDAESGVTSGFAPKRDGLWEITKVHGGEYLLEQWTEDQTEGTDSLHETPGWMGTPVSSNVSDDIPLVDEPMEVNTVPSQDTTKPLTKSQKQRRRKAKKQAAKKAEQLVPKPVDPPVVEPVRRSLQKRTRNTRLDDFVTFLQRYKFPESEPMNVSNNSD
uniref:RNA-directed DNA polymerase n=1 Tax=Strigamia maritima TaxID=126957 RepID=T1IJT1_STRMM